MASPAAAGAIDGPLTPFRIHIEQTELDDLGRRLAATRWPDAETVPGWTQGIPLDVVGDLCTYWRDRYDWRRGEAALNAHPQFTTRIDGLSIHFLHVRAPNAGALPLLLTHGWPGSVVEFTKVIGPLTDPVGHGGRAEDAFDLVIPSLPGVGFSEHPTGPGWAPDRVARAWIELMTRLGYTRWAAQGGDWGAMVTDAIGAMAPPGCVGIHLNMPIAPPDPDDPDDMTDLTMGEVAALRTMEEYRRVGSGYQLLQSTKPQTLAYALTDSPVGQAAWILEKFAAWSDNDGDLFAVFSMDDLLDNVMLYWLTSCAGSSARLYWDTAQRYQIPRTPIAVPTGISIFPKELFRPSRRWAAHRFTNIVHWNELDRGGHFAAFEQPELFVNELRTCFAMLRSWGSAPPPAPDHAGPGRRG